MNTLNIFVPTSDHQAIASPLLALAGIPVNFTNFIVFSDLHEHGKREIGEFDAAYLAFVGENAQGGKIDIGIIDRRPFIEAYIEEGDLERVSHVEWHVVTPDIGAWVLADNISLYRTGAGSFARNFARFLPLPDQIPFPYEVIDHYFKWPSVDEYLRKIDINLAMARCPSLKTFVESVSQRFGNNFGSGVDSYSRNLNRDIISNLMAEVSQPDMPVYRAADGSTYTAEQMIRHIREGSPLGQQYASDLLRVSRDMLARQAKRAG